MDLPEDKKNELPTEIKNIVYDFANEESLTPSQTRKIEKAVVEMYENGSSPKEALGISDDTIEGFYAHAYRLYQAAKYLDAGHIFKFLQTLNPKDSRFYFGMAACAHRLEKYGSAIFLYEVTSGLDKDNPMPLYYASDCMTKQGRYKDVKKVLIRVVERCKDKKEFRAVMERSLMTIASLSQEPEVETIAEETKGKECLSR